MNYAFSLEKNSKKYNCPNCNKKTYVRFVNNETNELLDYNYGRCDRETSCGYFKKPNDNYLSTNLEIQINTKSAPNTIYSSIVHASLKHYENNNLFLFLIKYFEREQVKKVFKKYYVGTSKKWDGATVFFQMDNNSNSRTGKIMLYNPIDGKRVKKPYNHISWVHKALKLDNYNLKQCLFGLHLAKNNKQVIGLVESEKTALTMNLFLPDCLWIATGSKQNLKEELLNPIKDHLIICYPDKSEFEDWSKKCAELTEKGFDIICSDLVEKSTLIEGADLADIYFDLRDLNEKSNDLLTPAEKNVQKLYSKNTSIKHLIEQFGLTDEGGNIIRTNLIKSFQNV